ncbi:acetyl-CoA carboxylase biotin carboxyl carrier protein [Rhodospirillaceae bacterium AH-315-P19]|nr:acetyl-CoA carboxylase biotin carboxyl carrier protein [Rhodospirillaceae bacterium AH-315-P19]
MRHKNKQPVNHDLVQELVELLDTHGLTELEYGTTEWHVRVARGGGKSAKTVAESKTAGEEPETTDLAAHPGAVKSPIVGTAFLAPEPGSQNFVNIGDIVKEGETLLLIEAMKTFNQIRAPRAGKVTQIPIKSGQPVEFGEVLMLLE